MRFGDVTVSPWTPLFVLALSATIWGLGWLCRRYRLARYLIPLVPLFFGVWIGLQALAAPHGYVAAYIFAGAWMLATLIFLASGILCFRRSSRPVGLAGMAASCALLMCFYLTYGIGRGITGPRRVEKIIVGPHVKADVVVLFKSGTDPWRLEPFDETVLHEPDYGRGHDLRPGISSVLSVRVGDHPGYAIRLSPSVQTSERAALMQRIASSPLVQAVFEDVAPNEITPESINDLGVESSARARPPDRIQ